MKRDVPQWVIQIIRHTKNLSRRRKVELKRWKKVHGPAWEETGRQLKEAFSPARVAVLDELIRNIRDDGHQPKMIRRIIPGTIAYDLDPVVV